MKPGMAATSGATSPAALAGTVVQAVAECLADDTNPAEPAQYGDRFRDSWLHDELRSVRNIRPAFAKWGLFGGLLNGAGAYLLNLSSQAGTLTLTERAGALLAGVIPIASTSTA